MKAIRGFVLIVTAVLGLSHAILNRPPEPSGQATLQEVPTRIERVLAEFEKQPYHESFQFLRTLREKNDLEALRAISELDGGYEAAREIAATLDAKGVVQLCRSLEDRPRHWRSAFSVLARHPREEVIDYILERVQSNDSIVRAHCYELCGYVGWPDLLEYASRDEYSQERGNDNQVNQPRFAPPQDLGHFAREYIKRFAVGVQ
jgi:HEAT repeat protein